MLVALAAAGTSNAETLLGKNFVQGTFGIVQFGDDVLDEVLGDGFEMGGAWNLNLNPNIDVNLGLGYLWADGSAGGIEADVTGLEASAALIYFFKPNEPVNPYVGAVLVVDKTEVELSTLGVSDDEDDTEAGIGAGAGVEIEATEDILVRLGVDYVYFEDDDGFDALASVGYWFNEQVLGAIGGGYAFESEDLYVEVGLVVKL
jgi:opacity protein-like surface antigen